MSKRQLNGTEEQKDEVTNLIMNMSGGLLPEYLTKDEVDLMTIVIGEDWFTYLGYSEPKYKKPIF